jgi:hypothetical protein
MTITKKSFYLETNKRIADALRVYLKSTKTEYHSSECYCNIFFEIIITGTPEQIEEKEKIINYFLDTLYAIEKGA